MALHATRTLSILSALRDPLVFSVLVQNLLYTDFYFLCSALVKAAAMARNAMSRLATPVRHGAL